MKKNIKKLYLLKIPLAAILSILLVITVFTLTSCNKNSSGDGSSDKGTTTLYVYNWGEYISDGSDGSLDVNAEFEKYYYETYGKKVKVNYSTFSSNEDMYAKLESGAVSYDVVIPSDYMIARMIANGMLAELNFDNIPNAKYISEKFRGEAAYYDPEEKYSIPYTYGMVGIIYNAAEIPEDEPNLGSWALMWDPKYSGNILQFNNSRDAFGTAQYFLGLDVNDRDPASWQKAYDMLLEQKSVVQGYVMDEIFNKMGSGSAMVAPYYAGDFFTMYEDNDDLAFYYPKEGTNIFVDAMCIPNCTRNKELAEIYINFMLSEEIAVANAEYICYASPNTLVAENEEYIEYMQELHPDAIDILYNSAEAIPTSYYQNLDEEQLERLNTLWDNLKIESKIGTSIYVISGIIIAALAVFFIVNTVINAKRRKMWDKVAENVSDDRS
ncbi:MAG: spermidine/putrescine ABC transporter substrate-binding protein [Eubacteriales bacterium]|nr:spermidine/putrescine ABC transporter substrate-binding protein [Eubacteriales bacterium]